MKTTVTLAAAMLFTFSVEAATVSGTWMGNVQRNGADLQLDLSEESHRGNEGFGVAIASLRGLERRQIEATSPTPVAFNLESPAGTFHFEGMFASSRGAGHFTFTSSEKFISDMRALGHEGFSDRTLVLYAITRLSPDWIRELRSMGYAVASSEIKEIAIFQITPAYAREIAAAGFPSLSLHQLKQFRIGGIDAGRLREYRALGIADLSPRSVAQLGIHGVTATFVRELAAEGYKGLSAEELIKLGIGNITAADIRDYRALGYDNIPVRELAQMGIHQVSPEYIRGIAQAGYRNVPLQKLIKMKIHDITPAYIESMRNVEKP